MIVTVEQRNKYLERRREDAKNLKYLLSVSDFDQILSLAHKFKGSGLTFGFPEISLLGKEIESAAFLKNREVLQSFLIQFDSYINGFK